MTNETSTENPIRLLRERAGLSRREFATVLGLGYYCVYCAESGYTRRPEAVFAALTAAGFDGQAISIEFEQWWRARMLERRSAWEEAVR